MNIEKDLQKSGIIATEKIDTNTILKITKNISKRIINTFPSFNINEDDIFSKLFSLNMYKAQMPEGMAEASYCYKNVSIYFNNHINDNDLEEFAIHECIHYLQEIKDEKEKIIKMGLSHYQKFKTTGIGLNEAAVQYITSKIINIDPDYEKYYDINIFTPSPSYYPLECALLNEIIFFIGDDILFKSTYFSTDDFKKEIIKYTNKKIYNKIETSFDKILYYEEKIIALNNKQLSNENKYFQKEILDYKEKIRDEFIQTQNLIIEYFFNYQFKNIQNLEQLEQLRHNLINFEKIIGTTKDYEFFKNFTLELMNKLEHKSNILENGGIETALKKPIFLKFKNLLKNILYS